MSPVRRVFALWRPRAAALGLGLAVALLSLAAGVALLVVSGGRVATGAGGALVAAGMLRGLGVARVALRYSERLATHDATFRALADVRVWFFGAIGRGGAPGLGFRRAGDVLERLVGDIEALDGLYLRVLVPGALALALLPVLAVLCGRDAVWLGAAVTALFVVAAFLLPALLAVRGARDGAGLAAAMGWLRVAVLDAVSGLREVRAFGAEGRVLAAAQRRDAAVRKAQRGIARRAAAANAAALAAGQVALLLVLAAAALGGAEAAMGAVVAAFAATIAFETAGVLPRAGALLGVSRAAAARVMAAADEAIAASARENAGARTPGEGGLRFEQVTFRWRPDAPAVLDGLDLAVSAGQHVALLGPSGAGKSTIAALALKVVSPERGRVTLGGVDLAEIPAASARARIGWLSQATHLFDDTIRANLLLGWPEADEAALWEALRQARLDEFVRALPDGLETWVGELGARLSGGQGRRLALARALLSPAPVLILDEAAAGLDVATEAAFFETLRESAADRTVLLIAHRLTGAERLDRVYRLAGGRAVAAAG